MKLVDKALIGAVCLFASGSVFQFASAQVEHTCAAYCGEEEPRTQSSGPSTSRSAHRHNSTITAAQERSQLLWVQSGQASRRHDYESAARLMEEAIRINPGSSNNLMGDVSRVRGDLAISKGDWKSAIYYYQQTIRAVEEFAQRPGIENFQYPMKELQVKLNFAREQLAHNTSTIEAPAGSGLPNINVPHFVKSEQLPPPPILKGDPPNATVRDELDGYMEKWKARNQEYQHAARKEAKEIKDQMDEDNKEFKRRMKKSYGVDFQ